MKLSFFLRCFFCAISLFILGEKQSVHAKVLYGVYVSNAQIHEQTVLKMEQDAALHPLLKSQNSIQYAIETPRIFQNKNVEFLLAIFMVGFVAVFRNRNPLYFNNLFRLVKSSSFQKRQIKDSIEQDTFLGGLLNLFFYISAGLYFYQVLRYLFHVDQQIVSKPGILIGLLILMIASMYFIRYLFLKFSGWAFGLQEAADNYLFFIFSLNRILGVVLIPITILLAFGVGGWTNIVLLFSIILLLAFYIFRYIKAIMSFSASLKISKFHFFVYLCATEILPMAILIKAISIWITLK